MVKKNNKILPIILVLLVILSITIIAYHISRVKAQETFTKPLLIIIREDHNIFTGGYEGAVLASIHADIVKNTELNYSRLSEYKVVYLSSSLVLSTDINWDWFKGNLTSGQIVIAKDYSAKHALTGIFGATIVTEDLWIQNGYLVVNGSSDLVGWISNWTFRDDGIRLGSYSYLHPNTTIPVSYQVLAYATNETVSRPILIYIEDSGVKYFFIVGKLTWSSSRFLVYHLMSMYCTDGFSYGYNPTPFMFVTHIHDYMYTSSNIDGLIDFINKTRVPIVWLLTPNANPELNKEAIDRLKQLGWINKYVYIGVHGYYHDDYWAKTYEEMKGNVSTALSMIRNYYGVEPVLEWATPSWRNSETLAKVLSELGFYAMAEYSFYFAPYNVSNWYDYHGTEFNNTQLHIFKVRTGFSPTSPTTTTTDLQKMVPADFIEAVFFPKVSGYDNLRDTVYWHTFNLDPSQPSYNSGLWKIYEALSNVYNLYVPASYMAAVYMPEMITKYIWVNITYGENSIILSSEDWCWVKIKGTWWHEDGLPTFHGTDVYGSWTIALLKPGNNTFYKTLRKPSIEYINAKVKNIGFYTGKYELIVTAPSNYEVVIKVKIPWEPRSVYIYYEPVPRMISKSKFDSATYDCWYYDPVNKLLYIKATAHSDVPIQVYSSLLYGDIVYPMDYSILIASLAVLLSLLIGYIVLRRRV